ncbi:MAG: YncE family protein [Terracidiphilus sp.]|jgi:YVTN family beta-propeller protein
MNFSQARVRLIQAGVVLAAAVLVAGCGNNYRPTVTPINPPGPASQPSSLAVVVSAPAAPFPGVATIIDYSGDTIMATAVLSANPNNGPTPTTFVEDAGGSSGYTVNSDGTITYFPVSTQLQQKQVLYSTVPATAQLLNLFAPSSGLWAADLCTVDPTSAACPWDSNPLTLNHSGADVFIGSPETYLRSIQLAPTPVMIAGLGLGGLRYFGISQGNSQGGNVASSMACNTLPYTGVPNGEADGIETSSNTVSSQIALGKCPVYAIPSNDGKRLFVLNRGSDTVSVINVQDDTLDSCLPFINTENGQLVTCHPTLPLSLNAVTNTGVTPPNGTAGMTTTAGPVYAEYNSATNQLVVANYDAGTISVIDATLDYWGNDGPTFGTTYTIPVGKNPASVTVLLDGSRAYVANQTDQTVSIVNLSSHTVKTVLPVSGHPRTVVNTQNSTTGKVYVASPDSNVLTIIRTDQDIVDTVLSVVGNIVDVRVTSQNAVSGNNNSESRIPGYGQPCNVPGAAALASLAACQAQ